MSTNITDKDLEDLLNSVTVPVDPLVNVTIGSGTVNSLWTSNTANSYTYSSGIYNSPSIYTVSGSNGTSNSNSNISVQGDAEFNGDIKWKGKSLGKMLESIEKRLAILSPDLEKLEHFAALKKAYDNYKTLEALCELPRPDSEDSN